MKNNKLWILIIFLFQPIIFTIILYLNGNIDNIYSLNKENLILFFFLSFIPTISLLIGDMNKISPDSEQRKKIQNNSNIPKELIKDKPQKGDFILGQNKQGKYICTNLFKTDTHYSICGSSGTYKSTAFLINNLILNDNVGTFVLDVKSSELYRKSTKFGDENVERFDPSDTSFESWGFDPFYRLYDGCNDDILLDSIQVVANSLITISPNAKDKFWLLNARNMFIGLAIKFYRDGNKTLYEIVDKILSQSIEESVEYVLEDSNPCDIEFKYLIMFKNMSEETLYGIFSELSSHLTIFNHSGIRYSFGPESRRKIKPTDLEDKKRIFICIDQTDLVTMDGIVRLILDVMLHGLQKRGEGKDESKLEPILFIIDELPQLLMNGPLSELTQGLRVLRSVHVRMVLAFQTRESLEKSYSSSEVIDIISNTNYFIVLNAGSSTSTMKLVCDLVGQFKYKKRSFSGKNHKKTTVSFDDENILQPNDINTLPSKNLALVLSPGGWFLVNKIPYFKCKYIKPISEEIERYNKNIQEINMYKK